MKILFDASVHFGQFALDSEATRIGCKVSQARISSGDQRDVIGVVSFNENSWVDHVVWGLDRETQDVFYRFMDLFHSVKQIERVSLGAVDARLAEKISQEHSIGISHALTCAVAIRIQAQEIHTLYQEMFIPALITYMKTVHGIQIFAPTASTELMYSGELEQYYQDAFRRFRSTNIDLLAHLRGQHC